jgi:hypothetical protein
VVADWRPISESVSRVTSTTRLWSSSTECSISESTISQSAATDVNGPM